LKVSNLMHESPNVTAETNWLDVVKTMSKYALGAVNVVSAENRLIGIVTEGDLRRTIEKIAPENLTGLSAERMMTADPVTAHPEMLAFDALNKMENRPTQISVLPVVDESGAAVGLLRLHDIVRSGL
jgi:arabinose-5-phosphate isomerase